MAQLPPKIPNWPDFGNATNITASITGQNPSWVDEFFDFSAAKRRCHRRWVSDPVTFVESDPVSVDKNEFDRFDDEQFINMFADDNACPSFEPSNPSTSSDNNSGYGDKKSEQNEHNTEEHTQREHQKQMTKKDSDEVQSQFKTEPTGAPKSSNVRSLDPKRVKRILANRQSAQRSRVRKLQYISELERSVTTLQAEVSMLSPRVAFLDQQRMLLNVDNSALKQRIAALAQDKIFKDAEHKALTREIERLRELYHQQNFDKMDSPVPSSLPSEAQQLLNISSS